MLRRLLLSASRSERMQGVATGTRFTRAIVDRFVAGEHVSDAVGVAADIVASGRVATIDRLGEAVTDSQQAAAARDAYLELLDALTANGLTEGCEVSLKLSSVGQLLADDGEETAFRHAMAICERAQEYGTTVTLDMEDHTTTDSTLSILERLRGHVPSVGVAVQAYLYRTESDCENLAVEGSRVRLCKGAYDESESVAYQSGKEIDLSFVRCLKTLMREESYPMVASHDPRILEIAQALAIHNDRPKGSYELQMLLGVRPEEQQRLADEGERVRVYIPYGEDWYEYMVRRMAEKPGNLGLFLKSMTSKK
ncbi:MAG: proline dehydrogenase family protein [Actinobacteria bacterium]|nr:proline dehydrogenase family protein [Actinomycetota bacterium]